MEDDLKRLGLTLSSLITNSTSSLDIKRPEHFKNDKKAKWLDKRLNMNVKLPIEIRFSL